MRPGPGVVGIRVRFVAMLVAVSALSLTLTSCSGSKPTAGPVGTDDRGPAITYVAVGASESVGFGTDDPIRQAWPAVLYRTLPRRAAYVNLGIPGATVDEALTTEVPQALALHPTLVTVWLNVNDITSLVPAATYEQQLGELVHQLRNGGATRVLVANTPPVDHLPAYLACQPDAPSGLPPCVLGGLGQLLVPGPDTINATVDAYNQAVVRVVAEEAAVLVDLHALGLHARAQGKEAELVGTDGFHPSVAGHQAVADAFAAALRTAGGAG